MLSFAHELKGVWSPSDFNDRAQTVALLSKFPHPFSLFSTSSVALFLQKILLPVCEAPRSGMATASCDLEGDRYGTMYGFRLPGS